jgi:hypothetical protein
MTRIRADKLLSRETHCTDRLRPITVTLHPHFASMRVKGAREAYAVPWDAILDLGRKLDAREKLAARGRSVA